MLMAMMIWLFSNGVLAQRMYDCSSVSCNSDQTCSPYDGECYDRFTTNDFVFSYWSEDTQYGSFDCGNITKDSTDISALFDGDNSTSFGYAKNYYRMINLTFSESVWIHKITMLVENRDEFDDTYIFNDDFATYADACGDDKEIWSDAFEWSVPAHSDFDGYAVAEYTDSSLSNSIGDDFPFKTQFLGIMIYHDTNAWISALNVYGIAQAPTMEPTSPTVEPTDRPTIVPNTFPTAQPAEYTLPNDPNLPTESPTADPPVIPTEELAFQLSTVIDSNEDGDNADGSQSVVLFVTIMVVMISFASIYVV